MIKGILFDYGGVVADGGRGITIGERLCAALNLTDRALNDVVMPLFTRFTRGQIDDDTFWQSIGTQTDTQISDDQRHLWDSWWGTEPYPAMLDAINTLKAAGYPVGLLSNIIPPAKALIAKGGGYDPFDFIILSCDVGFAKPEVEMYDLALDKFAGLKPEEIVFIDDQPKCMPPAETMGMQTILATSTDQVIEELRKLGLPV
jgi:putative hydrolase of the HAD superfamily